MGIAAELLPRVFDLFTQGTRSLDRSQGGLEIGLTLVKKLVELHGGTVEAYSGGAGKGSGFVVSLKSMSNPAQLRESSPPTENKASVPRSLRLLVVDDNVDAAETLAALLRIEGHRVRTTYDGHAALKAAREELPVVLLDIGLPGLDGFQIAEALSEASRRGGASSPRGRDRLLPRRGLAEVEVGRVS